MPVEVERFIRVQSLVKARDAAKAEWKTLPNCFRIRVWEMSTADAIDDEEHPDTKRFIFHIAFIDNIVRGCRVTYLGNEFEVLGVSDSTRLRGLELRCAALNVA